MTRECSSYSEKETRQIAAAFAKTLCAGDIVAYRGGLGAGKTVFTRGLAEGLHCKGEVSSPTFALVHEYPSAADGPTLYHFDMYRIVDADELYATGFYDYMEQGGILAIEWSENIQEELPQKTIYVTLTATGEQSRRITFVSERELIF